MSQISVQGGNQSQALRAFTPTSETQNAGADFRTLLGNLYLKPYDLMQQFVDPEVDVIQIEGFGPVDKNSPISSMIAAYYLNDVQIQMETSMNYLNFIYKTLPQMLEKVL